MRWLLVLYLAMAFGWAAAALRLPALMKWAVVAGPREMLARRQVRTLFFGATTPAAVFTVASGTYLFGQLAPPAPWPLIHLIVVGLLVWSHGATSVIVFRLERRQHRGALTAARVMTALTLMLLLAFVVIVSASA